MAVERFQCPYFGIQGASLTGGLDADVDSYRRFRSDHVGPRATVNYARIHRHAAPQVVHLRDHADLARQFDDRAMSLAGIEACVRRDTGYGERVIADAFARGFDGTAGSGCGLEH